MMTYLAKQLIKMMGLCILTIKQLKQATALATNILYVSAQKSMTYKMFLLENF